MKTSLLVEQRKQRKRRLTKIKLSETRMLSILSFKVVVTNQVYYHKDCLKRFNNQYESDIHKERTLENNNSEADFKKETRFRRIVNHLIQHQSYEHGFVSFGVAKLKEMQIDLLQSDSMLFFPRFLIYKDTSIRFQ